MNILIIGSVLQVHFALGMVRDMEPDYYWRDFTGDPPEDAFIGGNDIDSSLLYVGNAAFPPSNVLVGMLSANRTYMISAVAVIKTTKFGIKILCSKNPEYLVWEKINATTNVHLDMEKHLVRGGSNENGIVHIGRVFTHEGAVRIGSVVYYGVNKFCLWFDINGLATHTKDFEILIWDPSGNNFNCD